MEARLREHVFFRSIVADSARLSSCMAIIEAEGRTPKHMISIHLTFDDGPGPSTARLLDVLRDARFTATFFVLGKHAQAQPALLRRMVEEGHVIGNHTWLHAHDGELSDQRLEEGIAATDRVIRGAFEEAGIAVPGIIPLRLPYGTHSGDTRLPVIESLGRSHVGWTSLFHDWTQPDVDGLVDAMCAHIADQIGRGEDAVLCLHDASPRAEEREATVDAIERWLALRSH
jgi:peptidoglycan/xylan/chitin deacetylase (PgdA/CDA1 family)